jgi:hypothetical protein
MELKEEREEIIADLKKYGRLLENKDFISLLKEADHSCRINETVFRVLANNSPNSAYTLCAKEGAKAHSEYLWTIVDVLKDGLERIDELIKEQKEETETENGS